MLDGFEDKSGYAMTIYAYLESEKEEPILFIGKTDGNIVTPRGEARFGWDPNFEEKSTGLTYIRLI
jgi:inosine triphosphate pyrophosphatase